MRRTEQEPPSLWIDRIRTWQALWRDSESERRMYRDAGINNKWPKLVPWAGEVLLGKDRPDQVVLNLLERYLRRVQAMGFDDSPEIRFSRDRKGAEKYAEAVDRMLTRETEIARLPLLVRDGIASLCTEGAFALYVGVEAVMTRADVQGAGRSADEIVDDATAGRDVPTGGQDHRGLAQAMVTEAMEPGNLIANPDTVTVDLMRSAGARIDAAEAEEGVSRDREAGTPFPELLEYDSDFARDPTVCNPWHGFWMARRILLRPEEAEASTLIRKGVKSKLRAVMPGRATSDGQTLEAGDIRGDAGRDSERVELWEVWDRRSKTRHLVCEGVDEYLETDSSNPNVREDGRPFLSRFFPFALCEPYRGKGRTPKDCLPSPLFRSGWHKQIEYIKLDSHILQATKRACVDKYVAHPMMDDERIKALTDGKPGTVVRGNDTIQRAADALSVVEWRPPLAEAVNERSRCLYDFAVGMNFPVAELTSQPVADTATQEEMAMSSGNSGIADIIKILQVWYADAVALFWQFIQATYSEERLAEASGDQWVDVAWDDYVKKAMGIPLGGAAVPMTDDFKIVARKVFAQAVKMGPLSGEIPKVRFGATHKDSDPVRVKQLGEFTAMVSSLPITEVTVPLIQEMSRSLGLGTLTLPPPMPVAELAMQQAMMAAGGGGMGPQTNQNGEPKFERGDNAGNGGDRESVRKSARQMEPAL